MFFDLQKEKEDVMEFSKNTVKVLQLLKYVCYDDNMYSYVNIKLKN